MTSADVTEDSTDVQADETTALLAPSNGQPHSHGSASATENGSNTNGAENAKDDDRPLPRDQIFFLCLARLVDPIAFFCIFPFVNQMIWETGEVAKTDVGFYSGLIVSLGITSIGGASH